MALVLKYKLINVNNDETALFKSKQDIYKHLGCTYNTFYKFQDEYDIITIPHSERDLSVYKRKKYKYPYDKEYSNKYYHTVTKFKNK